MKKERNIITDGRVLQYLFADRHRHNRHDRVGTLQSVRDNRPDITGRGKSTLQKRSFEGIRDKTDYSHIG